MIDALRDSARLEEADRRELCDFALEEAGNAGLSGRWLNEQYRTWCKFE